MKNEESKKESTLKTISNILEGSYNMVVKKESVEEVAKKRMAICDTCPQKKTNANVTGALKYICNSCGCALEIKVRSLASQCPLKKWSAEE